MIVNAIIVTVGATDYLKSCLDSLMGQTHIPSEVIVINNSFKHNLGQKINELYTSVKLHFSTDNLLYCSSLNRGINLGAADFMLCLNDDVTLDRHFIEEALKGFSRNARVGMIGGKILRSDSKTIDSTGLFLSVFRTAKERGYATYDRGQFEEPGYIFGVCGAVAFYRRAMLEEIKLDLEYLDSDFRFFYEDLDIAWRAQNFGWKAYYVPSAIAYHVRGGSFRPKEGIDKPLARSFLSDELHYDLIKNRYLCIIKNESLTGFILHLPFILFYDIFQWLYVLIFRPKVIKLFFSRRNYFSSAFKKRKLLQER
jgi:GT2 family glycosyltransferase